MSRNRTVFCAAAALLTMVAGGSPAAATAGEQRQPAGVAANPVLQTVALNGGANTAQASIKPFSLVGVTWADPAARVGALVQVRTRALDTRRWSPWQTLETDGRAPADVRGSSDPLWVGPSDSVQARLTGARGPLPAGLRMDLINPDAGTDTSSRDGRAQDAVTPRRAETATAGETTAAGRAAVPLPPRPAPRVVTRAGWRANEAIVKGPPEYTGPTQVFFVHHTATGNGYSCAQSAGIVRGIQAYQVRSRGWDDIGYNFLIDKCGTVFEGRGGGIGRTVLGAHTLGFNANASAIAVIGSYGGRAVSTRVRTVIAAMAAYKLGAYGSPPAGQVVVTSGGSERFPLGRKVPLFRISGHRDAGQTACPGNALYAQLPSIRAIAGAAPAGLRMIGMGGSARAGNWYFTKGVIQPAWSVTTPLGLINRFEVWVDGVLRVATPAGRRSVPVRLTPGGHTVTVRALHLSGRSTVVNSRVFADTSAPVFSREPDLALRPGTVNLGAVPMHLDWTVRDNASLGSVRLTRPATVNLGVTARTRNVGAPANRPATFTVRATDRAFNFVSASVTRTPVVVSESGAQRSGTWRPLRNSSYLGGTAVGGSVRGTSASWRFSGSSVALVLSKGPRAGRIGVFLDGRPQGMVDLRSARPLPRQAVWSRWWPQGGEHTVRIVVEGTPGRPGVALDGLVYLK
ncbi:N-acetylmuramoyl-L-alanine amidase [Paractinoplanes hotanensis]|uniref:N-acetylmuramoyl-L-alanine amidase n=1 Tax=Paractinoplanes hotanensis TaxID=2906497 RepID=A0ABT0XY16_9ACTN|nr:N-acetylmuramoyl-L-alanine amidase [Actinoplanes hotanensis]MCM4078510.1 N-acetylmuramoyl-L-alanine amidase [Actinoplanes hotanensis]